jgi:hypothetical protein
MPSRHMPQGPQPHPQVAPEAKPGRSWRVTTCTYVCSAWGTCHGGKYNNPAPVMWEHLLLWRCFITPPPAPALANAARPTPGKCRQHQGQCSMGSASALLLTCSTACLLGHGAGAGSKNYSTRATCPTTAHSHHACSGEPPLSSHAPIIHSAGSTTGSETWNGDRPPLRAMLLGLEPVCPTTSSSRSNMPHNSTQPPSLQWCACHCPPMSHKAQAVQGQRDMEW